MTSKNPIHECELVDIEVAKTDSDTPRASTALPSKPELKSMIWLSDDKKIPTAMLLRSQSSSAGDAAVEADDTTVSRASRSRSNSQYKRDVFSDIAFPEIKFFDGAHITSLLSVFAQGQTVALLLSQELQSFTEKQELDPGSGTAAKFASAVYFFSVTSLLTMFIFGSMAINEKRCKEFFYYKAFVHGIMIDFSNHDEILFEFRGKPVLSKDVNIGSFTMVLTDIFLFFWVCFSTFSGQGSLSIDAMMRFVLIVFSLSKLYGPYKLFYATEDGLLSVSKFIENDPVKAKEILVTNQLQLESVCLNRLSDIWRLQQLAKENPENVEYKVVGEGFSWNQLSVKQSADGESPRLPKQNTLWAKLSFDPKVLDETKDVEKKDSVGAFLSTVPIRMSRLVASLTPWTSMLHEIDFRDEEENAQGQRLRKFGNLSNIGFALSFGMLLAYNLLLGMSPDMLGGLVSNEDVCVNQASGWCGGVSSDEWECLQQSALSCVSQGAIYAPPEGTVLQHGIDYELKWDTGAIDGTNGLQPYFCSGAIKGDWELNSQGCSKMLYNVWEDVSRGEMTTRIYDKDAHGSGKLCLVNEEKDYICGLDIKVDPYVPAQTVTSPAGESTIEAGTSVTVNWKKEWFATDLVGLGGTVSFYSCSGTIAECEYSYTNVMVDLIEDVVTNDGSESVTLPYNAHTGTRRICVYGSSNEPLHLATTLYICGPTLTIAPYDPAQAVSSPVGGTTWTQGSSETVNWKKEWIDDYVYIYSCSGTIAECKYSDTNVKVDVIYNDGSESFTLPTNADIGTRRICVYRNDLNYMCGPTLTIAPYDPAQAVSSPAGGTTWTQGSSETVNWKKEWVGGDVGEVKFYSCSGTIAECEYSGSNVMVDLIETVYNDGSESQSVRLPTNAYTGTRRICVQEYDYYICGPTPTIAPYDPAQAVSSPAGGTTWTQGSSKTVSWKYEWIVGDYIDSDVNIYSCSGTIAECKYSGTNVKVDVIEYNVYNDGSGSVTLPYNAHTGTRRICVYRNDLYYICGPTLTIIS